jgi:hypothetical protein
LFTPLNVKVPLPVLVKLPVVEALAPLIVSVAKELLTSIVDVLPPASVKDRLMETDVAPEYCKVPPSSTKFAAPLSDAPMLLLALPPAKLVTLKVPALIFVVPE